MSSPAEFMHGMKQTNKKKQKDSRSELKEEIDVLWEIWSKTKTSWWQHKWLVPKLCQLVLFEKPQGVGVIYTS